PFVQGDAGLVGQGDAADRGMQPGLAQPVKQGRVERLADAAAGAGLVEVDRRLDRVAVRATALPARCMGVAEDRAGFLRDQPWQAAIEGFGDARGHLRGRYRLGLEGAAGAGDVGVVDRDDGGGVLWRGTADLLGGSVSRRVAAMLARDAAG